MDGQNLFFRLLIRFVESNSQRRSRVRECDSIRVNRTNRKGTTSMASERADVEDREH